MAEVKLPSHERHRRWKVNIGSGNGLVPSGNKPLPEPILTQIFVAIWRHLVKTKSSKVWSGVICPIYFLDQDHVGDSTGDNLYSILYNPCTLIWANPLLKIFP